MRKTTNYGLSLYDKEDKMNITAEENSLNANMEIIDNALQEKANNDEIPAHVKAITEEDIAKWNSNTSGVTTEEATKTISVGTEAIILDSSVKEQNVNLIWDVPGAKTIPAFENYLIERSSYKYPRTFDTSSWVQIWSAAVNGNNETYVSGHQYFMAIYYEMDGESTATLQGWGDYSGVTGSSISGKGWLYGSTTPTAASAAQFAFKNSGTGTGTIYYAYSIDVTALKDAGVIESTNLNDLIELFGELQLIPGQNFEGVSTSGEANLTITRNGENTIIPSTETIANIKGGDVLKTDSGKVTFSAIYIKTITNSGGGSSSSSTNWEDKKWVAFGDSLTDETINADKKYYRYIQEKTNVNVVVLGKGGTGYWRTQENGTCFYQRMQNVPADADVITILGSINDWRITLAESGVEFGTATDTLEDGTLCGYINKCIDVAIEKAPFAQIALISAPYYHGIKVDTQNKLCEALEGVARHRRVKFLDLYHESGFRIDNPTFAQQFTTDYSTTADTFGHPNNAFHEKYLTPDIYQLLKRMLMS